MRDDAHGSNVDELVGRYALVPKSYKYGGFKRANVSYIVFRFKCWYVICLKNPQSSINKSFRWVFSSL